MRSFMKKVIVSVVAVLAGFAGVAQALNVDQSSGSVYLKNEYVPDRVIELPYSVASDAKCGQWWQLMADLGWSDADIAKGDAIIFRESRCNADSVNAKDPTTIGKFKGSFGLYQINLYWIKKTAWYPKGFLQTKQVSRNSSPVPSSIVTELPPFRMLHSSFSCQLVRSWRNLCFYQMLNRRQVCRYSKSW